MKQKIIFIIGSFKAGGAEKAMVNQLRSFDPELYDIYAYTFQNNGLFKDLVPEYVKQLPLNLETQAIFRPFKDLSFFVKHPVLFLKKFFRTAVSKLMHGEMTFSQKQWSLWRNDIPVVDGRYDIAVGHLQGIPNYFAIDKVYAVRRYLWIHIDFSKGKRFLQYEKDYFARANGVITVSKKCLSVLNELYPELKDKFSYLPNIIDDGLIRSLAKERLQESLFSRDCKIIVTVARFSKQKRIDRAIDAAKILRDKGLNFIWVVIGEGHLRKKLQYRIDKYNLQSSFHMIGLRANPYCYISRADIAVQSSDFEGKSIFGEECKILGKVFVSTNYDTVGDLIIDRYNGIITDLSPESLAEGIILGLKDRSLRENIIKNLMAQKFSNTELISQYYDIYLK